MPNAEHHSSHAVSRRDFFKIVTGSLVAMPTVAGGFLVPPTVACAEEDLSETHGGTADGVVERIVVVRKSEVGFCVVDMSKGGTDKVVGATVRVTSRYNGKSERRGHRLLPAGCGVLPQQGLHARAAEEGNE